MIRFLSSTEKSLFEELWEYFEGKYFTPEFRDYENINFDTDGLISPMMYFLAVLAAVILASSIIIFNRRVLGRLVRRLMSRGAIGYENAKTLDEIGFSKNRITKLFINRYTLFRAVRCVEEDAYYGIDPKDAPQLESSIGLENTERIKVPLWRRKADKAAHENAIAEAENAQNATQAETASAPCNTTICEVENNAERADDATQKNGGDEVKIRTSYEASLLAKKKYKRRADTDKFYILEAEAPRLRVRFDKKGTNPLWIVFIAVFVTAAWILGVKALPSILTLFDGVIGSVDNGAGPRR